MKRLILLFGAVVASTQFATIVLASAPPSLAEIAQSFSYTPKEFGQFKLLLDDQDASKGYYIYQDITNIPDAQTMDPDTLLGKVKDFFIYSEFRETETGAGYNFGLEMPDKLNKNSRLMSLTTGNGYTQTGRIGKFYQPTLIEIVNEQAQINVGGETEMRPELQNAIDRLSTKQK